MKLLKAKYDAEIEAKQKMEEETSLLRMKLEQHCSNSTRGKEEPASISEPQETSGMIPDDVKRKLKAHKR